MNEFLDVLKNYWQLFLAAFLFILSFILQLFKKGNTKIIDDSAFADLVKYVLEAESVYGAGHGKDKLIYVVKKYCEDHNLKYDSSISYAVKYLVEKILSTPQKKD